MALPESFQIPFERRLQYTGRNLPSSDWMRATSSRRDIWYPRLLRKSWSFRYPRSSRLEDSWIHLAQILLVCHTADTEILLASSMTTLVTLLEVSTLTSKGIPPCRDTRCIEETVCIREVHRSGMDDLMRRQRAGFLMERAPRNDEPSVRAIMV